jgi:hypothetical protein
MDMKIRILEKKIVKVMGKDIVLENTDRYLIQVEAVCPSCGMKAWFDPWQDLDALCPSCEEEARELGWGEKDGLGWGEVGGCMQSCVDCPLGGVCEDFKTIS